MGAIARALCPVLALAVSGGAVLAAEPGNRAPRELRMVAGGDVMLGRYFFKRYRPSGGEEPFAEVAPLFRGADIGFVNLETPLYDGMPPRIRALTTRYRRDLRFRAETSAAARLARAGINLVSLANNHVEDAGEEGVRTTLSALVDAGVVHAGVSVDGDPFAPVVREYAGGVRVALFAATTRRNDGPVGPDDERPPMAFADLESLGARLAPRLAALREGGGADLIVVSLHWGDEYIRKPLPPQRELAQRLIDAGAAVILGHHPHVVQTIETYRGGLILYSMGNLVFDMARKDSKQSLVFDIRFAADDTGRWLPRRMVMTPILLRGRSLGPRPARANERRAIVEPVVDLSRATRLSYIEGQLVWEAEEPSRADQATIP